MPKDSNTLFKLGFCSLLSRLVRDVHGTVLVQFTIYIVAILGMTGLAIDGGRFFLLNNSLQELADAAALAGAAELDGAKDAITRADTAAQSTANNNPPRWHDVGGSATITTTYYSALNPDKTTTDPKVANYIQVTTAQSQTAPSFLSVVKLVTNKTVSNNSTTATATAQGNDFANCGLTQSFICNPYEGSEANPGSANNFQPSPKGAVIPGSMFKLVSGAGAPGNWGLLEPADINGNPINGKPQLQTPFWAKSSLTQCTTGDSQGTTDTGNIAKFAQPGMNVRFDSPVGSGDESVSAPVVIDGFKPGGTGFSCNRIDPNITKSPAEQGNGIPATPCTDLNMPAGCTAGPFNQTDANPNAYDVACSSNPGSCPLPRDRDITSLSTTNAAWGGALVGSGPNSADLQAYWKNHHSGSLPAGVTTRYQIYQLEASGKAAFTAASDAAEPHGPTCTKSTVGDVSRRLVNVAVVDCNYWSINGTKAIPASTMVAQFFMTEPANGKGEIFGEYVGSIQVGAPTGNSNGLLHRIVQLVR